MTRLSLLVALLSAAPVLALDDMTYTVELAAPEQARPWAIVSVPLDLPTDTDPKDLRVTLTDTATKQANPAAEVVSGSPFKVVFRADDLKAGEKRTYTLVVRTDPSRKPLPDNTFTMTGRNAGGVTTIDYKGGDKTTRVAQLVQPTFDDSTKEKRFASYKPFVHLFDPSTGEVQLTNGAEGKYPHHRGIFYAFNKITYGDKSADCWHCTNNARQEWRSNKVTAQGPLFTAVRSKIEWIGQDKMAFASEQRTQSFYHLPGGTLFAFDSVLTPQVDEPVNLNGDPQHAGFHYRASQEVEAKTSKETYFLKPTGKGKLGTEENWDPKSKKGPTNLPWEVMSFVVGDQRYSVLYLDSPTNPKESRHSERTYGRIGNYFEFTATKEKPLTVHYRLWLQKGELTPEQCETLALDFVSPVKATATRVKQ